MKTRGRYLIKKGMQLGLTFRFLFLIIVFALFIAFEVYVTIWPVVSTAIPKDLIELVRHQVFFRLFFFIFPVAFVIAAFSIVFSHRITGPIYRLEQTLDRFLQGEDVEPVRIRKGDELKDLVDKINSLTLMAKKPESPTKKTPPGSDV